MIFSVAPGFTLSQILIFATLTVKTATSSPFHLSGRDVSDDYTGYTDSDDLREALQRIEDRLMYFVEMPTSKRTAAQYKDWNMYTLGYTPHV